MYDPSTGAILPPDAALMSNIANMRQAIKKRRESLADLEEGARADRQAIDSLEAAIAEHEAALAKLAQ